MMASVGTVKQGVSLMSNEDRSLNGLDEGQGAIIVSGTMDFPPMLLLLKSSDQAAITKHRSGKLTVRGDENFFERVYSNY
jgi:hypothetical protein